MLRSGQNFTVDEGQAQARRRGVARAEPQPRAAHLLLSERDCLRASSMVTAHGLSRPSSSSARQPHAPAAGRSGVFFV
jgi:hypothetical protein